MLYAKNITDEAIREDLKKHLEMKLEAEFNTRRAYYDLERARRKYERSKEDVESHSIQINDALNELAKREYDRGEP